RTPKRAGKSVGAQRSRWVTLGAPQRVVELRRSLNVMLRAEQRLWGMAPAEDPPLPSHDRTGGRAARATANRRLTVPTGRWRRAQRFRGVRGEARWPR